MQTRDGGVTWEQQDTPINSPIYDFVSHGDQLYAVGDHGSILALRNSEWVRLPSPNIPVYLSTGQIVNGDNGTEELLVAGGWGAEKE